MGVFSPSPTLGAVSPRDRIHSITRSSACFIVLNTPGSCLLQNNVPAIPTSYVLQALHGTAVVCVSVLPTLSVLVLYFLLAMYYVYPCLGPSHRSIKNIPRSALAPPMHQCSPASAPRGSNILLCVHVRDKRPRLIMSTRGGGSELRQASAAGYDASVDGGGLSCKLRHICRPQSVHN
ncbi:hypothetical protein BC628DRAFT_767130 [Trametes gibbosa]|nr:hypothetical protein BC628DRAFT_767130 [Trametes gibbosa]